MPLTRFYPESRKVPFIRLLIALSAGIVLQWYLPLPPSVSLTGFLIAFCTYALFKLLPSAKKFNRQWIQGIAVMMMILATGSLLCFVKNPLHQKDNYTTIYKEGDAIVATLDEALLTKAKTCKASATINGLYHNKTYLPATGTIIVYFDKTGLDASVAYGTQIVFTKSLQAIANTNNPNAFNYQRFLLFQGITAQVYLKSYEYKILAANKGFHIKTWILCSKRNTGCQP